MAITLAKSQEEIMQLPLVELAWEILKAKKEPFYFRDLMDEIQTLRGMSKEQVLDVIARLYTEINVDGRFLCIGQNVWGLKRWYPVDKTAEKATGKRFVRSTGDAFSDDDEDLDEDYDDDVVLPDEIEEPPLFAADDEDAEEEAEEFEAAEDDADFVEEEDGELAEGEPLLEDEVAEDDEEDEHF
ncbi:MAG: DNA-directed RNA polymerase subunit delta [Alicyclobacillus sp. RIFOXYA1_FULL_53_8]|nr:MAG: DNA-directed RNA polymerase subunit delta [Alicyclobacillus sp. RIFOXYA1_FULL_53_8]